MNPPGRQRDQQNAEDGFLCHGLLDGPVEERKEGHDADDDQEVRFGFHSDLHFLSFLLVWGFVVR